VRDAGQAREEVTTEFGRQMPSYAGVTMVALQQRGSMASILDFSEDPGDGGDDAASIYIMNLVKDEDEGVFGLLGYNGSFEAKPFGEQEAVPRNLDRVSAYVGIATPGNRPFARINSVGQL
jgi:hypothetical protein